MRSIKVLLLIFLALMTGHAAEATLLELEGRWDGAIVIRPAVIEVGLKASIKKAADGSWKGTLISLTHELRELQLEDFNIEGEAVSFVARGDSSVSVFHGNVSVDGSVMEGEVLEGEKRAFFRLRKTVEPVSGHPAIEEIAGNLKNLRSVFNQDQAKTRLLMILSPGCSDCRMKAFLIQQYVWAQIPDPTLRVYLVWEKVGAGDSLSLAREVTWLPPDPRVTFFWSEEQLAGKAFNEAIDLRGKVAWDVFLVYASGKHWTESSAPRPDFFMHNLPTDYGLPKENTFDVLRLAEQIKSFLAFRRPVKR